MAEFDHISEKYRGKVGMDLLAHMDETTKTWRQDNFDPLNDYQRHLYALFLKIAGFSYSDIWTKLYALAEDVEHRQRKKYIADILHSEIVGFANPDGSLLMIPNQRLTEA